MNTFFKSILDWFKHSILRAISVVCILAIIGLLGLGVKRILYPLKAEVNNQIVQSGGANYDITINNPEDTFFVGIKFCGLKLGVSKPTIKKMHEIIKETKKIGK
jgi:hypothetical protein